MTPLSPLTRRTAAVLTWVVATVLAGSVAWAAVGALGRGPGGGDAAVLSQADVAGALAAERDAIAAASASSTPTPTPSPTPTSTPTPTTAPTPGASPTIDPPATTEPVPTEVARTWTVTGGQVSASCTGARIALLYATPANGWRVEITNAGPEELEVELDGEDSDTTVHARCVDGTPQMTSSAGDGDDEHEGD